MAILKDLIVSGSSRLLGKLYTNDIEIGNDLTVTGATTTTKLIVNTTVNSNKNSAVNSSTGNLAVIIGTPTGKHIAMDVDEIAAKNGVTTASALWLNYGGGAVNLSTDAKIVANNGTLTAPTISNTTLTSTTSTITTANITTANTNTINNAGNIYNKNGTIETDVIKSNVWEIVSTQNLGGDFFVAPTIMVTNGSTFIISSVSGNTITGTLKDTTNITSANFGGHTWSANSLIKITGKLTTGSTHYILGTCDGKLTAQMNNTANTINFQITCNASTVPPAGTYTITDGTVMMYNVGGSNKVGIYMTCYGTDKYTYIDIYNGSNGNTPVARLGKLDNLKDGSGNRIRVGDALTTDYGIYTKNGFFEGKVVANGGTIAGWTIGDGYITTNSDRTTYDNTSYTGMTMTASGIGARGSATSYFNLSTGGGLTAVGATVTGVITANTGYIGGTSGWTIASQQLYSGTIGADNSLHLGTKNLGNNTSIGGRQGSDWRLTVGQHFGVTNTGALYCNDIHAAGGDIAGWRIESSYLASGTATSPAANVLLLSPNGTSSSYTIAGQAKTGWMITAGTTFGVNKDGGVYATGGKIGGFNITTNAIYSTTNALGTTANNVYVGTEGISLGTTFKVTKAGVLNATDATITGDITAKSFSALDSNSKERATVNTNGFIVKDASGNTVATLSNDLTIGQVVANRYNVFIDADVGIQNRKNTSVLSQFDSTSIKFYDGSGTAATNITAQFLSTGATIGKTSTNHVLLDSSGVKIKNGSTVLADFGSTITLGQTTGQAAVINSDGMQIYKGGSKVAEFGENITLQHMTIFGDYYPTVYFYDNMSHKDIISFGSTVREWYDGTEEIDEGPSKDIGTAFLTMKERSNDEGFETMYGYSVDLSPTGLFFRSPSKTHDSSIFINAENGSISCDNIGQVFSASKTVNVGNDVDSYTEGATITLPGFIGGVGGRWPVYLVHGFATFTSNPTEASRRVRLYNKNTETSLRTQSSFGKNWVTETIIDTFELQSVTDVTYAVMVSAGVAINNVNTYIKAVRIR